MEDVYLYDFLKTAREYYFIAPFTLDSVATNAEKTLKDLEKFDLLFGSQAYKSFFGRTKAGNRPIYNERRASAMANRPSECIIRRYVQNRGGDYGNAS